MTANPDGSFTSTEWATPHYVHEADGAWHTIDMTLHANSDGSISPVASSNVVVLSGGGAGFLAKQVSNGKELVWSWPAGNLPKPKLSGSTATYPDVLSGVDLVVRVDESGFSEVLVVKNAAAATNPALTQIGFPLSGSALTGAGVAGTASSADAAVDPAFNIGPAYMWDSTLPAKPMPADAPAAAVQDATVSDTGGPGFGAQQSAVPTRMVGNSLVLVPDAAMLASPKTTFPVFIDPKSSAPLRSYWTMIDSGHPSQSYWAYDRANHAKVGNAGDGTNMYRSLFQFSTSTWKGKHVTGVEFHDGLEYSWACTNTSTEIHVSASATIGSGTTWSSNNSTWGSSLDTASNQNCHEASGVDTEWASSALTSAVAGKASAATIVIGLRASDEVNADNGWKKFDETADAYGAKLSVTYNTAPAPSNLLLDGTACKTSSTSPAVLSTLGLPAHNPVPKVTVKDAEGDKSTVTFTYPKAGGGITTTAVPNVTSGATVQLTGGIPAANIPSGSTVYYWRVTVSDGTDSSTTANCYFKIDNTIPAPPTVVNKDGVYPDDGAAHGGVGKSGTFTITGAAGIVKYVWGPTPADPSNTVTTTNGAPVDVSFTPADEGDNSIQVIAYNAVGTPSAVGSVAFLVDNADLATGHWALNGDTTDITAAGNTLTPASLTWTADGRTIGSSVAHFNGTSSVITGPSGLVATDTSFAVSAWVRPNASCAASHTAVSEDGAHTSGFYLGCFNNKFQFNVIGQDSTTVSATRVYSIAAAPLNLWSNLVGVYDMSAGKVSLYVNGVLQGSVPLNGTVAGKLWSATGAFTIGREKFSDVSTGYWSGDIADVQIWDRVAYQRDIDALSPATWADQWLLNDTAGMDSKGTHPLTWYGSPQPAFDDMNVSGTPALTLSSATPDYALSSGPSVRTDGSFTVSAWINPAAATNVYRNAVSQNSAVTSNFGLGLDASNRYTFWMHAADVTSPGLSVASSATTATAGQWVNLIGTFDASTKVLKLYVNGVQAGTVTFASTQWNASGPLSVGSGQWQAAIGYLWDGGVDSVATFNGALTATQIDNLYTLNDPFFVES
ncbi:LamG-like jellyroll fold domain-containing protein [Actinoplanes sp. NPDC051411]|uniref:LamG domain-containing protein n=1 Tax=Actinoplanes sp. NPDC051411 TaxID=3155522 RepID=UPI00341B25EE